MVNSLKQKVKGLITRRRITESGIEESIIYFLIVSEDIVENVKEIIIDEDKKYAMAVVKKTKGQVKITTSDHNTIVTKFNIDGETNQQQERVEVFILINKECQKLFKEETSKTTKLSSVFTTDKDINNQKSSLNCLIDAYINVLRKSEVEGQ